MTKFVWYELMTTDMAAAETFYTSVVGWSAKDSGMPNMTYTMFEAGETAVGGMMALSAQACEAGARPGWVGYVGVGNVDTEAGAFAEDGGAVHVAPTEIPGVGRFAIVADPQGAAIALYHSLGGQSPVVAPGTPGHVGWRELHAVDGAAAFEFYARHFGWTKDMQVDMGAMGVYQTFAADGAQIGGMMTKMATMPVPFWLYYFNTDDIDAAVTRIAAGGGKVVQGPHEVPGGNRVVIAMDPQGAMFALVTQPK